MLDQSGKVSHERFARRHFSVKCSGKDWYEQCAVADGGEICPGHKFL